jgi:hypothetical protein
VSVWAFILQSDEIASSSEKNRRQFNLLAKRKATAGPSTRPGTPGLAQDDTRFLAAQDDNTWLNV